MTLYTVKTTQLKNMAKKVRFDKDEDGVKYKFSERTCLDCARNPCFRNMDLCPCDFAKYGCINYKQKS